MAYKKIYITNTLLFETTDPKIAPARLQQHITDIKNFTREWGRKITGSK